MTVEERAQLMLEEYQQWTNSLQEGKEELKARFAKHLRDQIEDCAKITDKYEQSEKAESDKFKLKREPIPQVTHAIMSVVCGRIGKEIRALAAPKEEDQEKGD